MKAVLISIRPQWVELIASGKKTVEVRKTRPKLKTPFKCYIYETKSENKNRLIVYIDSHEPAKYARGRGKVVGEFVCDNITNVFSDSRFWLDEKITVQTSLTGNEIRNYAGGSKKLYGWHISNLKVYDRPKELNEFHKEDAQELVVPHSTMCNADYPTPLTRDPFRVKRPPQSWCYVEELQNE